MLTTTWKDSRLYDLLKGFGRGFGLLFVYELIEEALEELIAWSISTIIAKAISFMLVVVLTQGTKIATKSLITVLKPAVKKLIYKEGNDKMNKLKAILASLKANWKNYIGIVAAITTAVIPFVQDLMDFGIGIQVGDFNIVPFVLIILTAVVAICGIFVDGVHGKAVWDIIQKAKADWKAIAQSQKEVEAQRKLAEAAAKAELAEVERLAKLELEKQLADAEAKKKADLDALIQRKLAEIEAKKQLSAVIEATDAKVEVKIK